LFGEHGWRISHNKVIVNTKRLIIDFIGIVKEGILRNEEIVRFGLIWCFIGNYQIITLLLKVLWNGPSITGWEWFGKVCNDFVRMPVQCFLTNS
jgi:hypothetical protein